MSPHTCYSGPRSVHTSKEVTRPPGRNPGAVSLTRGTVARAAGTACINTAPRVQDKAQGPGLRRDDECFEATSFPRTAMGVRRDDMD